LKQLKAIWRRISRKAPKPVLSIVIPTCDRPDTLEVCLRALAKQPNPHVEIIIQNNASDERTTAVIEAATDKRIVHHREETRISMRNNFENGVAAATGDYISLIGDDDAYCAGALDWIVGMLKEHRPLALRWQIAAYMWPSLSDANIGFFYLNYTNFYCGWGWRDARDATERMLNGTMEGLWESLQIYHGAVSRELYEETKAKTGGVFFQSHIPDVYVHTAMLLVAGKRESRNYISVGHPLTVYGMSGHSTGSSWYTLRSETRGKKSPMAIWESAAASDKHVKPDVQFAISCMKYHDYVAILMANELGLMRGWQADHEKWIQSIVAEVTTNLWQLRGFIEAKPVYEYEKLVIDRVLSEMKQFTGQTVPQPERLKKLYDECWRWQQICNISVEPSLPDDVETAVIVLDRISSSELGLRPEGSISDVEREGLRGHLKTHLHDWYQANPPVLPTQNQLSESNLAVVVAASGVAKKSKRAKTAQ
jgi:glycosyltransferase involved in cell wall biosynthesis